jgi:hypothetical protein
VAPREIAILSNGFTYSKVATRQCGVTYDRRTQDKVTTRSEQVANSRLFDDDIAATDKSITTKYLLDLPIGGVSRCHRDKQEGHGKHAWLWRTCVPTKRRQVTMQKKSIQEHVAGEGLACQQKSPY